MNCAKSLPPVGKVAFAEQMTDEVPGLAAQRRPYEDAVERGYAGAGGSAPTGL